MSLAYSQYYRSLQAIIDGVDALLGKSEVSESDALVPRLAEARSTIESKSPLRVVLVGEFSAGKSSIVSALTGAELLIDADVATTQVSEHEWRGLVLVDTPGVQAEDDGTDHDRIARDATIGADLILFVITNELFNPRLAAHLRYVLDSDGLGLAKKTSIIVNKIDRETNPDVIVRSEVSAVLGPHSDVPVYLCAAGKYLRARRGPTELKARFERQSRMEGLVSGLDAFVSDAGTSGRLATPLQVAADVLEELQVALTSGADERNKLELIRRQRVVLNRLQRRLLEIRKTWKQQAYSTVMGQANGAVEQIGEVTNGDELDLLFQVGLKAAAAEIDALYDGIEVELREAIDQAMAEFDEIGDSPLGQDVRNIEASRADRVSVKFGEDRPSGNGAAPRFFKAAGKPMQEGLEAAAKNAKGLRDIYYKVGKTFGKKFRPWEAVKGGEKMAKLAGKAGKAMPFLAAALDFYVQYREEKAKEDKARYLANLRLTLRNAFADQASVEASAMETAVLRVYRGPIVESLAALDEEASRVDAGSRGRAESIQEISRLQGSITRLRDQIYSGPEPEHSA